MTRDKDFKQLVRRRSRRTGESYAAARRQLLASEGPHASEHHSHRREPAQMNFTRICPILRSFDAQKARDFYVEYLGMSVAWEHRFEPHMPLYMEVARGDLVLHLSEHHGDGTPGSTVYIATTGLHELHDELTAKNYDSLNPGLQDDGLGTWMNLLDPFGNTLRFHQGNAG